MRTYLIAYAATAGIFLAMDFVWLSLTHATLYKAKLGGLLLDKPNFTVAALFYLFYAVGVVIFAVLPALEQGSWLRALWAGALLGFIAYGAYDLTNMATLAGWSPTVTFVDMAWGTFATGVAATAAYHVTRMTQ